MVLNKLYLPHFLVDWLIDEHVFRGILTTNQWWMSLLTTSRIKVIHHWMISNLMGDVGHNNHGGGSAMPWFTEETTENDEFPGSRSICACSQHSELYDVDTARTIIDVPLPTAQTVQRSVAGSMTSQADLLRFCGRRRTPHPGAHWSFDCKDGLQAAWAMRLTARRSPWNPLSASPPCSLFFCVPSKFYIPSVSLMLGAIFFKQRFFYALPACFCLHWNYGWDCMKQNWNIMYMLRYTYIDIYPCLCIAIQSIPISISISLSVLTV